MTGRNDHRELWWPTPSVEFAETIDLDLPDGFDTVHGGRLARIQVAWESWGTLNAERDNAILLVHPLASDPHASGAHWDRPDGWWDSLVGPGKAIDTNRYYVVCPNLLGGCYGTTGPRFPKESAAAAGLADDDPGAADPAGPGPAAASSDAPHSSAASAGGADPALAAASAAAQRPADPVADPAGAATRVADRGEPYLADFPLLTPRDLMRVQRLFAEQIGIQRIHRVIGPSMGAMVAWEWAIEGQDYLGQAVAIAAPLRTTAYQIGLNWLQRRGIELDLSGDELAASAGQMIARGVGMLSYRSPVGMEEKFGRDWFQAPGATLGKRGMYNVESWLRHHGKRSVKRFDPYTYILFSRAMDLHDVGEGRGGPLSALDHVQCDVLAVGISSDQLYTAPEVRLGVDMLQHLGKRARYAEIRSPHGHDAFLLESEQLTEILGTERATSFGPLPPQIRDLRTVRIGILGAGQVATRLLHLLDADHERLASESGLRFEPVAFAEVDEGKVLDDRFAGLARVSSESLATTTDIDALLDLTRGTASYELDLLAVSRGVSVVTPNKPLIRDHGASLERRALENGARLAYHNSIAAGWPLLYAVERPLGRERVHSLQAILSIACNGALAEMEAGADYASALEKVTALGWTEPDPDLDVSGWDTAQKLGILVAHIRHERIPAGALPVEGIRAIDPQLVREAPQFGYRVRLVALYSAGADPHVVHDSAWSAAVLPCAVPANGHLGGTGPDRHVLLLEGERSGELVFLGRGAGEMPVASAVLRDLVGVFDAQHSWTGRYPLAPVAPSAPRFVRFLTRVDGTVRVVDEAIPGSVPLLDSWVQGGEGAPARE